MNEIKRTIQENREALKCDWWDKFDDFGTDQQAGTPRPDVQKPAPPDAALVDLVSPEEFRIGDAPLAALIASRRRVRAYARASCFGPPRASPRSSRMPGSATTSGPSPPAATDIPLRPTSASTMSTGWTWGCTAIYLSTTSWSSNTSTWTSPQRPARAA